MPADPLRAARRLPGAWLALLAGALLGAALLPGGLAPAGAPSEAWADDAPPAPAAPGPAAPGPAAEKGPVYKNGLLGLSVSGPKGWTLSDAGAAGPAWTRLAAFSAPGTRVEVVLSRRARSAGTLDALEQAVRREWEADASFRVTALRRVDASMLRPGGQVQVEAVQQRKALDPAAPATAWNLLATYLLVPGYEVLLYAQGPALEWPRALADVQALLDSVRLAAAASGPEGEGAYRNDARGFALRYPAGSSVVVPQRPDHVVSFVPVSADEPRLDVYALTWKEELSLDAERLVKHYRESRGGEAASRAFEVAGLPGMLVTARVSDVGREGTVLLALVKRGDDLFRLKASMPRSAEAEGTQRFQAWVRTFVLTAAR